MAEKPDFLSFRADSALSRWVRSYSKKMGMSVSDVMREALMEYKVKIDSLEETELGPDYDALRSEIGHTFRVVKTDRGLLMERVSPKVVKL